MLTSTSHTANQTTSAPIPRADLAPSAQKAEDSRETIAALKQVFIPYPRSRAVHAQLDETFRYGNAAGESGQAQCFLLTGPSGSGKTAILEQWASNYPSDCNGGADRRPVLNVEVPNNCSPKALAETMLRALGIDVGPFIGRKTTTEVMLNHLVTHQLRKQKVQLVILDEFQHFINSENSRVIYKAADTVKQWLNAGTSSFVLAGTPEAEVVYEANEQLRRRSCGRMALKAFDWNNQKDQDTYRRLLMRYEERLPFAKPSGLARVNVALRLYHFSGGLLGPTITLLVKASIRALEGNAASLSYDMLREAVEKFRDASNSDWFNPFDLDDDPLKERATSLVRNRDTSRKTRLHRRGGGRDEAAAPAAA